MRTLSGVYSLIGCTKTDISRWSGNLFSTHASVKEHKINTVLAAQALFGLSEHQAESFANKAGLSLHKHENALAPLLKNCGGAKRREIYSFAVSERMAQYYIEGMKPTKQALLAIAIIMEMNLAEMEELLKKYGFCLSKSLVNDAVVRWYLQKGGGSNTLYLINEVLDDLELPLLMTKQINRNF